MNQLKLSKFSEILHTTAFHHKEKKTQIIQTTPLKHFKPRHQLNNCLCRCHGNKQYTTEEQNSKIAFLGVLGPIYGNLCRLI